MKRKPKKIIIYSAIAITIILLLTLLGISYYKKTQRVDYKLGKLGYTKEDIQIIEKLKKEQIKDILNKKYNAKIPTLIKQKYFLYENLDRYLSYNEKNKNIKAAKVISLVNVNRDKEFYTNIIKTDTSKENAILVNKYNALDKNFKFDDIVNVSIQHCYGTQKLRQEAYDHFIDMFNAAKQEDLTLIISSAYRDYDYQNGLWQSVVRNKGQAVADQTAAKAGHSEHQTALAMDLVTYNHNIDTFEQSDEFAWLKNNAYKYGFILRYPKDKEDITGYSYEPWHYRYVGEKIATEIYEKDITFDEYYAYYLK